MLGHLTAFRVLTILLTRSVDTTQVCEENQQAAGRKGSKMDGPNAHSKEKEKKKKGCLTKISNFITGSMEKGFYRSVKFFFIYM